MGLKDRIKKVAEDKKSYIEKYENIKNEKIDEVEQIVSTRYLIDQKHAFIRDKLIDTINSVDNVKDFLKSFDPDKYKTNDFDKIIKKGYENTLIEINNGTDGLPSFEGISLSEVINISKKYITNPEQEKLLEDKILYAHKMELNSYVGNDLDKAYDIFEPTLTDKQKDDIEKAEQEFDPSNIQNRHHITRNETEFNKLIEKASNEQEKDLINYAKDNILNIRDREDYTYDLMISEHLSSKQKQVIKKNIIEFGFSGYMADFGEYLPTDCVLFSKENPKLVHNIWPSLWAKLNREAIEETNNLGKVFFFTRAGYTDTVKYSTMMWNGDNHVDFSLDFGLASVIPAMLSLTCCGFGLSHSDIGGYTTIFNLKRSEEVYMRWCEMNAFSPLMRGHEGLNPDLNVQFDHNKRVLEHGKIMSNIHKSLKPYIKKAVEYNSKTGVGIIRPLFFYYDEERAYKEMYEYLLGRDILVAPITKPNTQYSQVYLPNDTWIHLESGKEYTGGTHKIYAPIGQIPVFLRKDAPKYVHNIIKNLSFGG